MRFKIDENLHDDLAALLATRGHDVETVHTEGLRGWEDEPLVERCRQEARALVTLDLDFADIRNYPPPGFAGIIVLRLGSQTRRHVLKVVAGMAHLLDQEPIAGHLWIVSDADVRIRGS
jgi:predicted nuclease of predicted toxin-antitoxin system